MATKTISLKLEAYERLRAARSYPSESFSQVVLRACWPDATVTGGELLAHFRDSPARLSEEALDRVEEASQADAPAEDKWTTR